MKDTEPLVSIILPSFNHESFIKENLTALENIDYPNLELLICDDGSTDGTREHILERRNILKEKFKRLEILFPEHKGLKNSLNSLIRIASGKYIFTLASDDVIFPLTIKKLVSFLEVNSEYVLAVGDNNFIDNNSQKIRLHYNGDRISTMGGKFRLLPGMENENKFGDYFFLLRGNNVPNGYLVRRSAYDMAGEYVFELEDWGMNLQLSKVGKFKFFPEVMFSYRIHGKNTILSDSYQKRIKSFYLDVYRREFGFNLLQGNIFLYLASFVRYVLIRFYMPKSLRKNLKRLLRKENE